MVDWVEWGDLGYKGLDVGVWVWGLFEKVLNMYGSGMEKFVGWVMLWMSLIWNVVVCDLVFLCYRILVFFNWV